MRGSWEEDVFNLRKRITKRPVNEAEFVVWSPLPPHIIMLILSIIFNPVRIRPNQSLDVVFMTIARQ